MKVEIYILSHNSHLWDEKMSKLRQIYERQKIMPAIKKQMHYKMIISWIWHKKNEITVLIESFHTP